jgi:PHD-finger
LDYVTVLDGDGEGDGAAAASGSGGVPSWPGGATRKRSALSRSGSRATASAAPSSGASAGDDASSGDDKGGDSKPVASAGSSPLSWRGKKRGSGALRSAAASPASSPGARLAVAKRLRVDYEVRAREHGLSLDEVEEIADAERVAAHAVAPEDICCRVRNPLRPLLDCRSARGDVPVVTCAVDRGCNRCALVFVVLRLFKVGSQLLTPVAALQMCGSPEDGDSMVLCDWCQQGCHLACHTPPLASVPDDDDEWFCPKCRHVAAHHTAAARVRDSYLSAQARVGVSVEDMLDATASLLSGEAADTAAVIDAGEPSPSIADDIGKAAAAAAAGAIKEETGPATPDGEEKAAPASQVQLSAEPAAKEDAEEMPKGYTKVTTTVTAKVDVSLDKKAAAAGGAISAASAFILTKKGKKAKREGDKGVKAEGGQGAGDGACESSVLFSAVLGAVPLACVSSPPALCLAHLLFCCA